MRCGLTSGMFLILLMISCTGPVRTPNARSTGVPDDRAAIDQAYDNWYAAWQTRDAELAARDYSDDAIWVNAFGMKRIGRAAIQETLERVFAMEFVMAGDSETVDKTVTFVRPDVAIVSSRVIHPLDTKTLPHLAGIFLIPIDPPLYETF